jgi:hypothetical protein
MQCASKRKAGAFMEESFPDFSMRFAGRRYKKTMVVLSGL